MYSGVDSSGKGILMGEYVDCMGNSGTSMLSATLKEDQKIRNSNT